VGAFYSIFSIFINSTFTDDSSMFNYANIIEKVYMLFMMLTLMFSITRKVEYSSTAFGIGSVMLGIFMFLTLYIGAQWF
jgi:hypothetical protein